MSRLRRTPLVAMLPVLVASAAPAQDLAVRIVEPDRGDLLAGQVVLRAEVEAGPGVTVREVEFVVDGAPLALDRTPPYEALWHGIDPLRDHLLRVTAVAEDGARSYGLLTVPILGPVERISVTGRSPEFVVIGVTFLDARGRPLVDVRKEELRVLEDGDEQIIDVLAPDDRPLAVELLLDASGSTQPVWTDLSRSTRLFAETLREGDRAAVLAFNNKIVELAPLGSDREQIEEATAEFTGWGGTTRLYDALTQGSLFELGRESTMRRAIVVLTDGLDWSSSTMAPEDAQSYLLRNRVALHGVLLFSEEEALQRHGPLASSEVRFKRDSLIALAYSTGGSDYETSGAPMEEVFLRIGERLRAQYLLGYNSISPRPPGKPRRVEVQFLREGPHQVLVAGRHYGSQSLAEYLSGEIERGPERRRVQAVFAAAGTSDPVALRAVVAALADGRDLMAGVSRAARLGLLERGAGSVPYLVEGLDSGNGRLAARAAEVLVDLLFRLADGETDDLRQAVAELGGGEVAAGRERLKGFQEMDLPERSQDRLAALLVTTLAL